MKRILIFSHALELGGAERALLGLLEAIDYSHYEVDLFLMRHIGELINDIPEKVNLLPENPSYSSLAVPFSSVLKKRQVRVALGRLNGKCKAKKREKQLGIVSDSGIQLEYSHKHTNWAMPMINEKQYDLAISFLTPHYFVANKVKANTKIAWIHTDYSKVKIDVESELKMWNQYDYIASISESVTESFLSVFPELKEKIRLIQNMMPVKCIKRQIQEFNVSSEMLEDGSIKLLSIGRFCTAKNFDNVPGICRRIRGNGIDVKWYLIGYGGDEELIRKKIKESEMEDYVIILGKKENPYPYISACDIYVQPSRYEGNSVTVREAQLLNKPVIITDYPTSKSQLEDGVDGIVVPIENDKCAKGICKIILNQKQQERLIENTKKRSYANISEIEKIYDLL